ncbi:UPF0481 protein At3g47200-like [Zingiber officinale]|uniref:Uncharacterized protein n=1 Tax=Zingiber officinale TaxID=94328 RepID=A0A8J5KV22_ZINOF|nr:UPF0481 protein At3g47200-like [Zingiber officinale]XP_042418135.1 UPF0481 protein At3g47200-like [Zingiber officinale]KAG6490668.1 hypothetical protein ZIOFF_051978 [Zingiber officinale]
MVAVFNKEVLSWYLLTLKLNEAVQANLPRSQPSTPGSPSKPPPSPPLCVTRGEPIPEEQQPEEDDKDGEEESTAFATVAHRQESEWVISIRDKLEQARHEEATVPWARFCIYRVPKSLREGDEEAYVPQVVSIGPYHHGKRRLRDMDRHKWRALHRVLRRTGHDVRLYLEAARALEDRCRACYEGRLALSSDEFVEMLVLDGTFLLELFRGVAVGAGEGFRDLGYDRNDPVFAMRSTMHGIQRDMIMLENQLPLFILDRLLGIQIGRPDQHGLVARLAVRFFDPLMPTDEPLRKADRARIESSTRAAATESFDPLTETGLHCLDIFRRSLLLTGPKPEPRLWIKRWSHTRRVADRRRLQLIHCVTELREAGIKFRKRKTDRFWDIKFADGVLKIPRLLIHDGTKSLFLNLIALEQCHSDCTKDITSYVIFMNNLINSEVDVSYLHYRGIIEHWLGSDRDVADLFNKLCQEVVFDFDDSYLSELSERVNRYYNHRWNTWGASLKHRYFGNPWAIISLIAAVFLLLLTCAQTFYSAYAYYHPP